MSHREFLRSGYAYVGVSAQKVGIDGVSTPGASRLHGAEKQNPKDMERSTPGDSFPSIFIRSGKLVRATATVKFWVHSYRNACLRRRVSVRCVLDHLHQRRRSVGEGVRRILVHSRFGGAASLQNATMSGDQSQPWVSVSSRPARTGHVVETETDVINARLSGYQALARAITTGFVWELRNSTRRQLSLHGRAIDSGRYDGKTRAAWAPMSEIMVRS